MTQVVNQGVVQSLAMRAQRELLTDMAQQLGSPIVFLKAAWADPVLYGGMGVRLGTDIDVLVPSQHFIPMRDLLLERGFAEYRRRQGIRGQYLEAREITLQAPKKSAYLAVDLHRALAEPCWFRYPTEPLFARLQVYEGSGYSIPSLCPEDQVVYACVHYGAHAFDLDERHLMDVAKLVCRFNIDWRTVQERATAAGLQTVLALLLDSLRHTEAAEHIPASKPYFRVRGKMVRSLIGKSGLIARRRERRPVFDYLLVRPLLSDSGLAAIRFGLHYGLPWLAELATRHKPPQGT